MIPRSLTPLERKSESGGCRTQVGATVALTWQVWVAVGFLRRDARERAAIVETENGLGVLSCLSAWSCLSQPQFPNVPVSS